MYSTCDRNRLKSFVNMKTMKGTIALILLVAICLSGNHSLAQSYETGVVVEKI